MNMQSSLTFFYVIVFYSTKKNYCTYQNRKCFKKKEKNIFISGQFFFPLEMSSYISNTLCYFAYIHMNFFLDKRNEYENQNWKDCTIIAKKRGSLVVIYSKKNYNFYSYAERKFKLINSCKRSSKKDKYNKKNFFSSLFFSVYKTNSISNKI